jgi:ABC-2 type transport system ATP-binding protein
LFENVLYYFYSPQERPMIEVQNLLKDYGSARAVAGISFSVQPGEVVGLLGPNGAGKSTTLRILTGYLPPTQGTVKMASVDIQEHPLEARQRLGYLSETNPLYESLGVWECLELFAKFRGLPSQNLKRRLARVVEQCSLESVVAKDVSQISKGYRQRLGLALAILHDPDILILDEPTSALDPNQQQEVRDLILSLKEKKTVLLSTHILPEAQNICDRLLIIHQGRIVAQGTVAELQGRMEGETTYYVRLKGPADAMLSALRGLPAVSRAEMADQEEGGSGFHLSSSSDPRQALFELTAEKRWPILELRRRSASLDEIFRSLTGTP